MLRNPRSKHQSMVRAFYLHHHLVESGKRKERKAPYSGYSRDEEQEVVCAT
jgi:hypothetical protein